MADILWPKDLAPYRVAFYLQPHVGGQESPITRTRKTYGLSAPRWVARLTFRGGYQGDLRVGDASGFGARLDSLIADLEGGLNIAIFHDWRRPRPRFRTVQVPLTSGGALVGSTSMIVRGFAPFDAAFSLGDYVGGDGRPHIISAAATIAAGGAVGGAGTIFANADGEAIVGFKPALSMAVPVGAALSWPVTGRFELSGEDAGQNETTVGEAVEYILDFAEKLA